LAHICEEELAMRTVDWRMLHEEHAEPGELRRVLTALAVSMGGDGGQTTNCSPSMARIGRRAGMRRDDASKWIRIAEVGGTAKVQVFGGGVREVEVEGGWINVGRVTGLRNKYYATVPKSLKAALTALEEKATQPKPKQERKFREPKEPKEPASEPLTPEELAAQETELKARAERSRQRTCSVCGTKFDKAKGRMEFDGRTGTYTAFCPEHVEATS
jgi:hypothetical protein